MLSRILVGVDGSEHTTRNLAVATAPTVGRSWEAHTDVNRPHPSRWAWDEPIGPDELRRDAEHYYEAVLRNAAEAVPQEAPTPLLLRHGRPAGGLFETAGRDHYDLITVGSRERGRLRPAVFGGLGQRLERQKPRTRPGGTRADGGRERKRARARTRTGSLVRQPSLSTRQRPP